MSIKSKHSTNAALWFITFTCYEWKPLIEITSSYDLVYKWFQYLKEKEIADIICFVVMPNHIHVILLLRQTEKSLNTIVANGKRFMAYEIIKRLTEKEEAIILSELESAVSERERNKGQKHKVFQDSFDGKDIQTEKFLFQKMDYIHRNPVSGKWSLVKDFTTYEHSSASFYELEIIKHFEPKHYKDIF